MYGFATGLLLYVTTLQTVREVYQANRTIVRAYAEKYCGRSMYFPYLQNGLEQLHERFTAQTATAYALSSLLS